MKIRIEGTLEELQRVEEDLPWIVDVRSVSKPYQNRGSDTQHRIYVDAEALKAPLKGADAESALRTFYEEVLPARHAHLKALYDGIVALEHDLEACHDDPLGRPAYRLVKALAACYELQDYLANQMAADPEH